MARRDNIKLVGVAAFALLVGTTAPAVGHGVEHALFAHKADQVDGKHAVGAGATPVERASKLVATNKSGLLPGDIVAKVLDSESLDGLDSTQFLRSDGKAVDADQLDGRDLHGVASHWVSVQSNTEIWGRSDGLGGTTVVRPAGSPTGVYCVFLPAGINSNGAVGSVQQTLGGDGEVSFINVTTFYGSLCNSTGNWDVAVQTYDSSGRLADRSFNIQVPGLG